MLELLNKETAVRNVTGVTVHGSVARLPGVRTGPASGPSRPPQGRTVTSRVGIRQRDKGSRRAKAKPDSTTRATSTLAYSNPSPSSHGSEMVKTDRRGLILTKPKKKIGGQPAGTAGRRQVRCRVIPGTADRDYFGGTVVSDKNSCPLEILPASALSDRSERLPTLSDSQPCDIFFPGSH